MKKQKRCEIATPGRLNVHISIRSANLSHHALVRSAALAPSAVRRDVGGLPAATMICCRGAVAAYHCMIYLRAR